MSFAPDMTVSEHGCDMHAWDPLSWCFRWGRTEASQQSLTEHTCHQSTCSSSAWRLSECLI